MQVGFRFPSIVLGLVLLGFASLQAQNRIDARNSFLNDERSALQVLTKQTEAGIPPELKTIIERFEKDAGQLPNLIHGLAEAIREERLPSDEQVSAWVYRVAITSISDFLVRSQRPGLLGLRNQRSKITEQGFRLRDLEEILRLKNNGEPIEIELPIKAWDENASRANQEDYISTANRFLAGWVDPVSSIRMIDLVRFVSASSGELYSSKDPWPGVEENSFKKTSLFRSRIIPPLAFAASFLGGMITLLSLDGSDPAAMKQALGSLAPVTPYFLGGVAGAFVFRNMGIGRSDTFRFGLVTLATLVGVSAQFGTESLAILAPALAVGATSAALELMFSFGSNFFNKWLWEIGWFDALKDQLTKTKGSNSRLASPPNSFRTRANENFIRPAIGFGTNFTVNTAYPAALELSKVATSFLILKLGFDIGAHGQNVVFSPDFWSKSLSNAVHFTAAFGLAQIMIGALRRSHEISSGRRADLEAGFVLYNGAIARVLAIALAMSAVGDGMMKTFALGVTLPLVALHLGRPLWHRWSDRYVQFISRGGDLPNSARPIATARRILGTGLGACGHALGGLRNLLARKPTPL